MKFAGKAPLDTHSPFLIEISNYTHTAHSPISDKEAKISYSCGEMDIWIKGKLEWFNPEQEIKQVITTSALGRNERVSYPQYRANIGSQMVYGGSDLNIFTSYASNADEAQAIYEALGVSDLMNRINNDKNQTSALYGATEPSAEASSIKP